MDVKERYYLAFENRPNDFMPIDISLLEEASFRHDYSCLYDIDGFTMKYSLEELYEIIKKANLVPDEYLEGTLHVINNKKYRFKVYTKEINYDLVSFITENIEDKQIMNKLINICNKYDSENIELLKKAIESKNEYEVVSYLYKEGYNTTRHIYMYIYDNIINNLKEKQLTKTI